MAERENSGGWRPISSAPRDGTRILIWCGAIWQRAEVAAWFEPWANWQRSDIADIYPDKDERHGIGSAVPTHWQPITPPDASEMEGGA